MSKFINNANAKKPFCKVCFDAKKPESEYTSHRVRSLPDMNGKTIVTCPVLAATECRYCYQFGHTTKFCTVLEENKKKAEKAKSVAIKEQRAAERAAAAQQVAPRREADLKYAGKFAGLEEEDEPEVVESVAVAVAIKQAEFPTLGQKKDVKFAAVSQSNWAAMAAKPAAPSKPAPVKMNTTVLPSRTWDLEESDSEDDAESYPALPTKAVEKDEWDDLPIISSSALMDNRSYLIAHSRALAEDDEW